MKKIIALLLALCMIFALVACGSKEAPAEEKKEETSAAPKEETPAEQPKEETPAEQPKEEPKEEAPELVVDTMILKEADDKMLNTYSVLAVNPEAPFADADGNAVSDVTLNTAGADALYQWLVSQEALDMAGAFGVEEYGSNLF